MMALNHLEARQWIERAADGLLSAAEQSLLAAHLAGCAECRAYAAELAELEAALGSALAAHWGSPQMDPEALEKLVDDLKTNAPGAGGSGLFSSWPARLIGLLLVLALAVLAYFASQNRTASADPTPTASATLGQEEAASAEDTATPSNTPTYTATPTPAELVLIAIPEQTANCRYGNSSSQFDIADTLFAGQAYTPLAKGPDLLWVYFQGPVTLQHCWVYIGTIQLYINQAAVDIADVPEALLPIQPYPPTPTPTPTATFTPQPTSTFTPTPTCTPPSSTAPGPTC